jgi:hypothetical protein
VRDGPEHKAATTAEDGQSRYLVMALLNVSRRVVRYAGGWYPDLGGCLIFEDVSGPKGYPRADPGPVVAMATVPVQGPTSRFLSSVRPALDMIR